MPQIARITDITSHGAPLTPGPGSPDVNIGGLPVWRALPAGAAAGVEQASAAVKSVMEQPMLRPWEIIGQLIDISGGLNSAATAAAMSGSPAAPGATSSALTALLAATVKASATYATASAVPGGEPAAAAAFALEIQAAAAAAASSAISAIAAMTDMHVCPMPSGLIPHGPGVVTRGSPSVFINKLPVARQGDQVVEAAGGNDPIAIGCMTVNIGDLGSACGTEAAAGGSGAGDPGNQWTTGGNSSDRGASSRGDDSDSDGWTENGSTDGPSAASEFSWPWDDDDDEVIATRARPGGTPVAGTVVAHRSSPFVFENRSKDGRVAVYDNGTIVTQTSDGRVIIIYSDHRMEVTDRDGTQCTTYPDGSSLTTRPGGSVTIKGKVPGCMAYKAARKRAFVP
jgi:uncharacterized Zn-binding protein involved in type VI secretion